MTREFRARFLGRCDVCAEVIEPGDDTADTTDGGTVHVACVEDGDGQ